MCDAAGGGGSRAGDPPPPPPPPLMLLPPRLSAPWGGEGGKLAPGELALLVACTFAAQTVKFDGSLEFVFWHAVARNDHLLRKCVSNTSMPSSSFLASQ